MMRVCALILLVRASQLRQEVVRPLWRSPSHKCFPDKAPHLGRFSQNPKSLKPGMVFVDIGSYTGSDLIGLALAQPKVQIYTFEPVPSVYKKLVERTSKFKNVHARNVGIGDAADTLCFLKNRDATKVIPKQGDHCPTEVSEEVHHDDLTKSGIVETGQVMPVDVLFAEIKKIDVLQINCEGCEYIVLPAILNSPATLSKITYVEVQFHNCEHETETYCKVANMMKDKFDVVYNTDGQWTRFVKRV